MVMKGAIPPLPHLIPSLSLFFCHVSFPLLYDVLCLGQSRCLCQARPDKKKTGRSSPCPSKDLDSKPSRWHLATLVSPNWFTFCCHMNTLGRLVFKLSYKKTLILVSMIIVFAAVFETFCGDIKKRKNNE
ncbi:hypothetical protein XENOCAPTIV_027346 [Xenoophorus captivus]|uniref:Uncharacterized protein n=1 Tax=Xenoophorus captivus TaxID=1517983 RepID=A0ABV0RXH7_9TELE